MSAPIIPFPSDRELCHWCGDFRKDVETLTLSQDGASRYRRTTLKVCHFCIESWAYWAKQAERKPKTRLR
jgi:hypothetical protein